MRKRLAATCARANNLRAQTTRRNVDCQSLRRPEDALESISFRGGGAVGFAGRPTASRAALICGLCAQKPQRPTKGDILSGRFCRKTSDIISLAKSSLQRLVSAAAFRRDVAVSKRLRTRFGGRRSSRKRAAAAAARRRGGGGGGAIGAINQNAPKLSAGQF